MQQGAWTAKAWRCALGCAACLWYLALVAVLLGWPTRAVLVHAWPWPLMASGLVCGASMAGAAGAIRLHARTTRCGRSRWAQRGLELLVAAGGLGCLGIAADLTDAVRHEALAAPLETLRTPMLGVVAACALSSVCWGSVAVAPRRARRRACLGERAPRAYRSLMVALGYGACALLCLPSLLGELIPELPFVRWALSGVAVVAAGACSLVSITMLTDCAQGGRGGAAIWAHGAWSYVAGVIVALLVTHSVRTAGWWGMAFMLTVPVLGIVWMVWSACCARRIAGLKKSTRSMAFDSATASEMDGRAFGSGGTAQHVGDEDSDVVCAVLIKNGCTPREAEALGLALSGLSSPDAAAHMGVGASTVRTYLQRAYAKLGAASFDEARGAVARLLPEEHTADAGSHEAPVKVSVTDHVLGMLGAASAVCLFALPLIVHVLDPWSMGMGAAAGLCIAAAGSALPGSAVALGRRDGTIARELGNARGVDGSREPGDAHGEASRCRVLLGFGILATIALVLGATAGRVALRVVPSEVIALVIGLSALCAVRCLFGAWAQRSTVGSCHRAIHLRPLGERTHSEHAGEQVHAQLASLEQPADAEDGHSRPRALEAAATVPLAVVWGWLWQNACVNAMAGSTVVFLPCLIVLAFGLAGYLLLDRRRWRVALPLTVFLVVCGAAAAVVVQRTVVGLMVLVAGLLIGCVRLGGVALRPRALGTGMAVGIFLASWFDMLLFSLAPHVAEAHADLALQVWLTGVRSYCLGAGTLIASLLFLYELYESSVVDVDLSRPSDSERLRSYLVGRGLTTLQVNVALGIIQGETGTTLARRLSYSRGAINGARRDAYRLLGVHTRQELIELVERDTHIAVRATSFTPGRISPAHAQQGHDPASTRKDA